MLKKAKTDLAFCLVEPFPRRNVWIAKVELHNMYAGSCGITAAHHSAPSAEVIGYSMMPND